MASEELRAKRMKNLKPFKKGDDPWRNLNGNVPKHLPELRELLAQVLLQENVKTFKPAIIQMLEQQVAKAKKGDTAAAKFLIEYGWGKAIQPIAMEVRGNITVDFTEL